MSVKEKHVPGYEGNERREAQEAVDPRMKNDWDVLRFKHLYITLLYW